MKTHLALFFMFLAPFVYAQTTVFMPNETLSGCPPAVSIKYEAFLDVQFPDVEASFVGGYDVLRKYLTDNLLYPQDAKEEDVEGRVYLAFVVDKFGKISNVIVERGVSPSIDKEAIRLVQSMPDWIPAQVKGEYVKSVFRLPIVFRLDI